MSWYENFCYQLSLTCDFYLLVLFLIFEHTTQKYTSLFRMEPS